MFGTSRITTGRALLRTAAPVLGALVAALLTLLTVVELGKAARSRLHERPRYVVAIADIVCEPPAGLGRREFLEEVQYLAGLPAHVDLRDPGLPARLSAAFARHPWVESVGGVSFGPRRRLEVRLTLRKPVLAVPVAANPGDHHGEEGRAVDRHGVLLPARTSLTGLPTLPTRVAPPAGPAGTPWGDPLVTAAARTAALPRP